MFQTKKALRARIRELERQLEAEHKASAIIDGSGLPKCESLACVNCEHIVFHKGFNQMFVVGCGKGVKCPDFQRVNRSEETQQSLQEGLLRQQS